MSMYIRNKSYLTPKVATHKKKKPSKRSDFHFGSPSYTDVVIILINLDFSFPLTSVNQNDSLHLHRSDSFY